MYKSPVEIASELGARIKLRRIGLGLTQMVAAERAGVSYRTWRRMENEGKASIEDLARAAIALRAQTGFDELFPEPVATSMDELLQHQRSVNRDSAKRRVRVTRKN